MGRKDLSTTGTGGVRSAGAAISGAREDAAAPAVAEAHGPAAEPSGRKDSIEIAVAEGGHTACRGRPRSAISPTVVPEGGERRPYTGPRRGGVPKGLHPLKGLIAPNFVETGVITRPDLLDFMDSASWRTYHPRNHLDLRGAAMCAMIACCGATMSELTRIMCSHWLPEGRDEIDLGGAIHRVSRTTPVLTIAKIIIEAYNGKVKRAAGVEHLFVDDDGLPATTNSIVAQIKQMTTKNGIPVDSLAMSLQKAFERWAGTEDDPMMRALTGRTRRKWLPPDPEISVEEKAAVLEKVHPLGLFDREMLQWKGPHARRYPNPHFPALSREARTEYEFAVKTRGGAAFGAELRDAVRTALDSGKSVSEVAGHYGMNVSFVQDVRDGKIDVYDVNLRSRPLQLSLLKRMRSDPAPTAEEARAWAADQGIDLPLQRIYKFARKHGVELTRSPRFWIVDHGEVLLARMRQVPAPSVVEVRAWASARRIDLTLGQIADLAGKNDVVLAAVEPSSLAVFEAALLARAKEMPDADLGQLAAWLSAEQSVRMAEDEMEHLLLACGWTKPVRSFLTGHTEAVRDLIAADPDITYRGIQAWLADCGVLASTVGIQAAMAKAGIEKPSQSQAAKKARAAARS